MAFTIRTDDGRTSVSTSSAEQAASFLLFLSNAGFEARATSVDGREFSVAALRDYETTRQREAPAARVV